MKRLSNFSKIFAEPYAVKNFLIGICCILLMISTLSACDYEMEDPSSNPPATEDEDYFLKGIPDDILLWCLEDHAIRPSQFENYTRWYKEIDDTIQVFRLYEGEYCYRGDGKTKHARLEAHSGLEWRGAGTKWHTFEAKYRINTETTEDIAIAQIFDYDKVHPQLMVIYKNGRITYQHRGLGNKTIATGYKNKHFTIKLRSNGTNQEIYFNGEKISSARCPNSAASARNGFRWGLYLGEEVPKYIWASVRDITRN